MSAEERKNTPPELGDADTVFADFDSVKYMSAEEAAYDAETAGIKEQLIQSQEKLNKMEVVSKKPCRKTFEASRRLRNGRLTS